MKKVTLLFGTFIALFFISCEGPAGPPGYDGFDGAQGPPGADGSEFEAIAFEVEIDFDINVNDNKYEFFEPYPSDIALLASDVILVYRLEAIVENVDIWRQMPQPFLIDEGTIYYNFDFTMDNYGLYIEPEFDVSLIPLDLAQNQIFRIVVIPANLGTTSKLDKSNINAVMRTIGVEEKDVQRYKLN